MASFTTRIVASRGLTVPRIHAVVTSCAGSAGGNAARHTRVADARQEATRLTRTCADMASLATSRKSQLSTAYRQRYYRFEAEIVTDAPRLWDPTCLTDSFASIRHQGARASSSASARGRSSPRCPTCHDPARGRSSPRCPPARWQCCRGWAALPSLRGGYRDAATARATELATDLATALARIPATHPPPFAPSSGMHYRSLRTTSGPGPGRRA